MTKVQTRRSFSISGYLAERLQAYADAQGRCVTEVIEQEMRKFLNLEPNTRVIRKPRKRKVVQNTEQEPTVAEVAPAPVTAEPEAQNVVPFEPRKVQPRINTSNAVIESAAERRERILREAHERQVATGWVKPGSESAITKPVNKAKPFNRVSRMGKRHPAPDLEVEVPFVADGDDGLFYEDAAGLDA